MITVDRHLNDLYPFMGIEKTNPQEVIHGLAEDPVVENLNPETGHQLEAQDEFHADIVEEEQSTSSQS